jgi:hypothetical protein
MGAIMQMNVDALKSEIICKSIGFYFTNRTPWHLSQNGL